MLIDYLTVYVEPSSSAPESVPPTLVSPAVEASIPEAPSPKGVHHKRKDDIDRNCHLPIDSHVDGKTKRLQTSTIIKCGGVAVKLCLLEHYKDDDMINKCILPLFTPQPPPKRGTAEVVGICGSASCPTKGIDTTLPLSVYSVKELTKPMWLFCSFNCVVDKMSICSDTTFSRQFKKISNNK